MGRTLHYRPGSFYRTDDRTGFVQRAEVTRREWNNLIVDQARWEPRQPQDLVKGVPDIQSVKDPRPLGANVFVGPLSVQTTLDAVIGQTVIPVQTSLGFYVGAKIGCMTDYDGGVVFFTTVEAIGAEVFGGDFNDDFNDDFSIDNSVVYTTISLAKGLPYPMAAGNLITLYQASPPPAQGLP